MALPVFSLKQLRNMIQGRRDNDFDVIMIVDGGTGKGKSTLVYQILKTIKGFKLKKHTYYDRDLILNAIENEEKTIIWADEMINIAHNRSFFEPDQIELVRKLNMYRDSNNLYVGCIPEFSRVDSQLLTLCHIRLTVIRRGCALIQMPKNSLYSRDPWDIKNNAKIESKWTIKGGNKPRYAELSTSVGYVMFGDLTEKQKKEYKENKRKKRQEAFNKANKIVVESDPNTIFYKNLLEQVKSRTLTPVMFAKMCQLGGKKMRTVQIHINELLKAEGINESYKDFVNSNNNLSKKDKLGFNFPTIDA